MKTAEINRYLARLDELATTAGPVHRFFIYQDDELYDLESELADSEAAEDFYDQLIAKYREWQAEMEPQLWQSVVDYNDSLNGANRNWLLDEI